MLGDPFPDLAPPPAGTASVHIREHALPGNRWSVRCVLSDEHPDGCLLDDPIDTDGVYVLWRVGVDDEGRGVIRMNRTALGTSPPLWYVMLPEADASRPAMTLVGFATDHLPVGTIITDPVFFMMPVESEEQVGAIRWWYLDGVVDEVYVDPKWRRRGIATDLIYAVGAWQAMHGHPVRIRSDGRRTELGAHFEAGARFPSRFAPITEIVRPMDPPEA